MADWLKRLFGSEDEEQAKPQAPANARPIEEAERMVQENPDLAPMFEQTYGRKPTIQQPTPPKNAMPVEQAEQLVREKPEYADYFERTYGYRPGEKKDQQPQEASALGTATDVLTAPIRASLATKQVMTSPDDANEPSPWEKFKVLGTTLPQSFKAMGAGLGEASLDMQPEEFLPPQLQLLNRSYRAAKSAFTGEPADKPIRYHEVVDMLAPGVGTGMRDRLHEVTQEAERTIQYANEDASINPGEPMYYVNGVLQATVEMAPMVTASILTKNPRFGLAVMGSQIFGREYSDAIESGRSQDEAFQDATFYSLIEAVTEKVPLDFITRYGKKGLKSILSAGVAEGLQEQLVEGLSMGYETGVLDENAFVDPETGEFSLVPALKRLRDAGIIGFGAGGLMRGGVEGVRGVAEKFEDRQYRQKINQTEEVLRNFDETDLRAIPEYQHALQQGMEPPEAVRYLAKLPLIQEAALKGAETFLAETAEEQEQVDLGPVVERIASQEPVSPQEASQAVNQGMARWYGENLVLLPAGRRLRAQFSETQPAESAPEAAGATITEAAPQVEQPQITETGAQEVPAQRVPPEQLRQAIDDAAAQAATSDQNGLPEPTEGQKDAGNYKKGKVRLHGMDVSIENPAGSQRRPEWPPLQNHYGYIRRTEAADGEQLDAFIGPRAEDASQPVFVVDQTKPDGSFDEQKALLGWDSPEAAAQGYLSNYSPDFKGLGRMVRFDSVEQFRDWAEKADGKRPAYETAGRYGGQLIETPAVERVDTPVSESINQPEIDTRSTEKTAPRSQSQVQPGSDSLLEALSKLTNGRGQRGLSTAEAEAQGVDPAAFKAAGFGIQRAFTKNGMSFDEAAEALSELGYPVTNEQGQYDPNVLVDRISEELSGKPVRSMEAAEDEFERMRQERMEMEDEREADRESRETPEDVREADQKRIDAAETDAEREQLRKEIRDLRTRNKELEARLRTSQLTGLPNLEAFEAERGEYSVIGAMDMDGLGWFNEEWGHETTNKILQRVGEVMQPYVTENTKLFHVHGDEFALATKESLDEARGTLSSIQEELDNLLVEVEGINEAGETVIYQTDGLGITFGIGKTYEEADNEANKAKKEREKAGLRSPKGEEPVGVGRIAAETEGRDTAPEEETDEDVTPRFARAPQTDSPAFRRWFGDSKVVDENGDPLVVYHGTNQDISTFSKQRAGSVTKSISAPQGFFFTDDPVTAGDYAVNAGTRVVSGVSEFEKKSAALKKKVDRLERKAQATQRNEDWTAYEEAFEEWENLETGAINESPIEGQNIAPVYLSIQSPLEIDANEVSDTVNLLASVVADAKKGGHDGVIIRNFNDSPSMVGPATHYIVFRPEQIKSATGNRGTFDPTDPDIRMRRGDKPAEAPKTERIRRVVADVANEFAGQPFVQTVESVEDLPAGIRAYIGNDRDAKDTKGVYVPGSNPSIYVIAGNTRNENDAIETLAHEMIGHHGTRAVLGDSEYFEAMDAIAAAMPGKIRTAIERNGLDRMNLSTEQMKRIAAEEVIAYTAQDILAGKTTLENLPSKLRFWFERIMAAVRRILGKADPALAKKATDADIIRIIARSYDYVRTGRAARITRMGYALRSTEYPPFIAQLIKTVNDKLPERASPKEYLQAIKANLKKPGLTREEFKATGLEEKLNNLTLADIKEVNRPPAERENPGEKRVKEISKAQLVELIDDAVETANKSGQPLFQKVFHGTPHKFDKFSLEAIGTGEGAQAYGWGLYFAGKREIAEFYKDAISYRDVVRQFRSETPDDADIDEVMERVEEGEYSPQMASLLKALHADDWLGFDYPSQAITAAFRELDAFDPSPELREAVDNYGSLYETEIPEDSELLDWDAPLGRQPKAVQKAVSLEIENVPADEMLYDKPGYRAVAVVNGESFPLATYNQKDAAQAYIGATKNATHAENFGERLYETMRAKLGSQRAASMVLNDAGISGLRYLDASSRSEGEGTRNYVIWDDSKVTIEAVNDELRQAEEAEDPTIPLFAKADKKQTEIIEGFRKKRQGAVRRTLPELVKEWTQDWKARLNQAFFDDFYGIKRAETEVGQIPKEQMGYLSARLAKGADDALRTMLEYGALEWDSKDVATRAPTYSKTLKPLFEVLSPLRDAELMEMWKDYIVAKRAKRLKAEDRERLFTSEEIETVLKFSEDFPILEEVAQEYAKLNRALLDFAEAAGLVNPDTRKLWENEDYVPFYRVVDDAGKGKVSGPFSGTGRLANLGKVIRSLRGGRNNMGDPLDNIIMNWSALIRASLNNHAAVLTIDNLDGTGLVTKAKQVEFRKEMVPREEVAKRLRAEGAMVDDMSLDGFMELFAMKPPEGDNILNVFRNGKREYWEIADPLLFRSMTAIGKAPFGPWMNIFRIPKRVMTSLITLAPSFSIRNWFRDAWSSFVLRRDTKAVPMLDGARGFVKTLKKSDEFKEMMAGGATFESGYVTAHDPGAVQQVMRARMRNAGFRQSIVDSPMKFFEFYRDLTSAAENANRVPIYQKTLEQTGSRKLALYESKDIMDFAMRGSSDVARFLSESVAFFNARLQGLYRIPRTWTDAATGREKAKLATAVLVRGTMIMLPTLVLYLRNRQLKCYNNLPDYDKDLYYHFFVGDISQGCEKMSHYRLPKPFEVGAMFSTIPERMLEAVLSKEPDKGKKLAERLEWTFSEMLNMNPVPTTLEPPMELFLNRDTFRDAPILNMYDQKLLPEMQYDYRTPPTYRFITQYAKEIPGAPDWIKSPKQLEHLVSGWGGTLFNDYAILATDALVRWAQDYPPPPAKRLDELPFVKSFVRDQPIKYTTHMDAMYNIYQEVSKYASTARELENQISLMGATGNESMTKRLEAELDWIYKTKDPELIAAEELGAAIKTISGINEEIMMITLDAEMSPEKKREEIDRLYEERNEIAEDAIQFRPGGPENLRPEQEEEKTPEAIMDDIGALSRKRQVEALEKEGLTQTAMLVDTLPTRMPRRLQEEFRKVLDNNTAQAEEA